MNVQELAEIVTARKGALSIGIVQRNTQHGRRLIRQGVAEGTAFCIVSRRILRSRPGRYSPDWVWETVSGYSFSIDGAAEVCHTRMRGLGWL